MGLVRINQAEMEVLNQKMPKLNEKETILLPQKPWETLEKFLKMFGEKDLSPGWDGDDKRFLQNIGFLTDFFGLLEVELTEKGQAYFKAAFIKGNVEEAREILKTALLGYPPVEAIIQNLWGVKEASVSNVLTVLKASDFWFYEGRVPLTHLLNLLNEARIIRYDRKNKKTVILESLRGEKPPKNIFIDPARPYSNIIWIKRVLGECEEFIYWIDKHFQKEALEWIWEVADASRIKVIKIISIDTGENLNKKARDEYKRLKKELLLKEIELGWYTIESRKVRNMHDRWVLGKGYARNIPNVNAILSGQRAELNRSDNFNKILKAFEEYLEIASLVAA